MKKTKEQKGITLIALIITIIILLILAVVTINSIKNDGIIAYAKNAKVDYQREQVKENTILQSYLDILDKNNPNKEEPKDSLVAMYKAGTLKVGDYVQYNPSKNENGTAKSYTPDGEGAAGSLTGYTDATQSVVQEDLNWRVLGYDETKNELLLISGAPTTTTSGGIKFLGVHVGYNNYEDVLNTTCSNLYSNSTIGASARSITMNDIDTYLGGSAYDKTSFDPNADSDGSEKYGYRSQNISSTFSLGEDGKLTKVDTPVILDLTSNAYMYTASDVIKDATKLEILIGNGTKPPYYNFVASRSVAVGSDYAGWCGNLVDEGGAVTTYSVFCGTWGDENANIAYCLRPVVSIPVSVTTKSVSILETAPNETWNDPYGKY